MNSTKTLLTIGKGIGLITLSAGIAVSSVMAQANKKATPEQESIAKGKSLVNTMNCSSCHMVAGDGGTLAPPLDGISAYVDKAFIVSKLSGKNAPQPHSLSLPEQLMSHNHVAPFQARFIADYLFSLPAHNIKVKNHGPAADDDAIPLGSRFTPLVPSESSRRGAKVFTDAGCIACHSIGGTGGHIAPNLSGIGARRSRQFIESRILNGAAMLPSPGSAGGKASMPPNNIDPKHLKEITDFLLTLPPQKPTAKAP